MNEAKPRKSARVTLKIAGVWVAITETLIICDMGYEITYPPHRSPYFPPPTFQDLLVFAHLWGYTLSAMVVLPLMMVVIEIWNRFRHKQTLPSLDDPEQR